MFRLNLKIALRSIFRNKVSSFINVIGLAIGLAACLMLLLYVSYEWNFDRQAKNAAQVYKIMSNLKGDDGKISMTHDGTVPALAPAIRQGIPEIKAICRLNYGKKQLISNGNISFKKDARFAEQDIFKMYDYQFIAGDPATAMDEVHSVILTESTAKVLFGTADVLNKSVRYQDKTDLKITGVIKDQPDNSSNKFDYLMPWSFYETVDKNAAQLVWDNFSYITLCLLAPNSDIDAVNQKIGIIAGKNTSDLKDAFFIYPLTKIHLYGKFEQGRSVGGDITQIWLFMGLAIGILLIACINFMNMATARSERRAKEVGIKKTIGANRRSLVFQFLTESMVLTFVAVVLAIAILEISLPTFNHLLDIKLGLFYFDAANWLYLIGIVFVTSLIAGSYPAFYLSSFSPVQNLKGKIRSAGFLSVSLRQVLVVGQFCFAIILIISTMVIYWQIKYIKDKPVGFDIDALVELPQEGELKTKYDLFKTELLRSGAVSSMYQSSVSLSHHNSNFIDIRWDGMAQAENRIVFNKVATTYDFVKTNGIRLIKGRDFSEQYASDSTAILISASAAKTIGYKEPVGKTVSIFGNKCTIIGVFNDYIWDSPYQSNNPMVVYLDKGHTGTITMRLNKELGLSQNIGAINKIAKQINPAYPVEINFLNTIYSEKYKSEKTLGILSNLFGGLAIFISCLGLFGLVAYSAEQRTKEFGVRKVLGASVFNLMGLLSLSFVKLILVAIIIAVPLAYYAMNKWLQNFEFHVSISWWVIALASAGTLLIALLTLSFQAYKSAVSNPVDALKYE
ncbi:ABC transporter permease [Pedobacter ginsengisoli]|uniref:ABC transporter permease n=1 Tax=Pedobacter ginsengisoli TaxID=363852 RepID=UPI00254BF89B|nr:ABC transporter permease [Pedobacter ginsengisoli]